MVNNLCIPIYCYIFAHVKQLKTKRYGEYNQWSMSDKS